MEISQLSLALLYLFSACLGVLWGILYDALKLLRLSCGAARTPSVERRIAAIRLPLLKPAPRRLRPRRLLVTVFLTDLLFCLVAALSLILLFYAQNNGKLRPLALLCAPVGFWVYRVTLSRGLTAFLEWGDFWVKTGVRYVVYFLLLPIRFLFGRLSRGIGWIQEKRQRAARLRETERLLGEASKGKLVMHGEAAPRRRNANRKERVCQRKEKSNSA